MRSFAIAGATHDKLRWHLMITSAELQSFTELLTDFARVFVCSYRKEGFSSSMYGMSKLCEVTYTRVLGEQLASKGILANACCPGYTATDMSSWRGTKHASEGADTPAWLALLAPTHLSAKFFSERQIISF